jgi:hypothetical protein
MVSECERQRGKNLHSVDTCESLRQRSLAVGLYAVHLEAQNYHHKISIIPSKMPLDKKHPSKATFHEKRAKLLVIAMINTPQCNRDCGLCLCYTSWQLAPVGVTKRVRKIYLTRPAHLQSAEHDRINARVIEHCVQAVSLTQRRYPNSTAGENETLSKQFFFEDSTWLKGVMLEGGLSVGLQPGAIRRRRQRARA